MKPELKITCEYELVEQIVEYALTQGNFVNVTSKEYQLASREFRGSELENCLSKMRLERSRGEVRKSVRRLNAEKLLAFLQSGKVWEHINAEYMLNHLGRGLIKAALVCRYSTPANR